MNWPARVLAALVVLGLLVAAGFLVAANVNPVPVAPDQEVAEGDPAQGQRAIVKYGCGACHVIPGVRSADGVVGPPLEDFAERSYVAGNLPNTPANLIAWILDPQEIEPGTAMPDLNVGLEDAVDIAAYLYTLQ